MRTTQFHFQLFWMRKKLIILLAISIGKYLYQVALIFQDLPQFCCKTGFNVEIPANLFKGDDHYTFTATTSSDRTAEATIAYEVAIVFEEENEEEEEENQEEEDGEVVEEGFITIEENQDYLISYRLVDKDGSKVEEFETAQTLQFKFIFSIDDEFIQKCFSYGEVEDDI
eukprot:CAMPEP_0114603248 /NCGR_PEP_ID=MMETSP0125-20121206/25685_1 /TAXON_ID=485358 ORGANISM="Aristerostoma sp., Strain ATCC 50986" /NCGR_SAMPLE_ID=MMETSP0125 /ASSEMBLY_ACC=CAM_ASM_000245 /LENGTH=169 /DNA_ID=CAMNT_0001813923 /DNA_START=1493 /DNA_END=2004 /DNA_ORIENTATION=-